MRKMLAPILGASLLLSPAASAGARPASSAQPQDAAKLAEAHAIIQVMFPPAQRQKMFDDMLTNLSVPLRKNLPAEALSDPGLNSLVSDLSNKILEQQRPLVQRHIPALLDAMALAYTHEFSLAELKEIHDFADTPAGSHYLSRSSALLGDPAVVKANSDLVADAQALSNTMLIEFKDKLIAYLKAHPDVAAKLEPKK